LYNAGGISPRIFVLNPWHKRVNSQRGRFISGVSYPVNRSLGGTHSRSGFSGVEIFRLSLAQQFFSHLACREVAIPTTQSRLYSPNVITEEENPATKQVALKLKTSLAQIILVTKLQQRNLGVKEKCALNKLYVKVWTEFIWLRIESGPSGCAV
jgi:hypothetical protein